MKLYNIANPSETATFREAVLRGSASGGGLYQPTQLAAIDDVEELLRMPFVERSARLISSIIGDEFASDDILTMVRKAFDFPVSVKAATNGTFSLELFHGPTLAFKDFGARFMAQILGHITGDRRPGEPKRITILTATSGDTGAAVAHAFLDVPGVEAIVLYPAGRISPLQEKLFCTLGRNIRTFRVDGDFDACQSLVKGSFKDEQLVKNLGLTSANSINISRLLAQICYYFEGVALIRALPGLRTAIPVISVPCGNFGNLTAGLMARRLGLPVKRFVVATNANDTIPRFLAGEPYQPRASMATLANAMDVGAPNNWSRIVALYDGDEKHIRGDLTCGSLDDDGIRQALRKLWKHGFMAEPHTAIAWSILKRSREPDEIGLFLATAHPAKFRETVEEILEVRIDLPPALSAAASRPLLSEDLPNSPEELRRRLLQIA
ncbi:MAG: threonine synthase [Candidatus Riflebacteria bacterium]|nr:threonine synthase [Candidatus Riflebacteria bacterium]